MAMLSCASIHYVYCFEHRTLLYSRMDENVLPIDAVTPDLANWSCRIRVVSKVEKLAYESSLKYLKMIFADAYGNLVDVVIFNTDVDLFQETLAVDETYIISNTRVKHQ